MVLGVENVVFLVLICGVLICFFLLFGFADLCSQLFAVLMRFDVSIWFPFSFNKITDFHFDLSFHFAFENFFLGI
jgi:hypothetical protein